MRSLLRSVKKRKKRRVLGEVEVMSREEYSGLELDSKVEMIRALIPLGLMHVEELLDEEVKALAGERYARKEATLRGRRHGSNPGTVGLGGQRVPVRVPRVRSVAGGEIPLRSYEELSPDGAVNELLLRRVLYGISCRNYESAAEAIPGAIGLSSSTVLEDSSRRVPRNFGRCRSGICRPRTWWRSSWTGKCLPTPRCRASQLRKLRLRGDESRPRNAIPTLPMAPRTW